MCKYGRIITLFPKGRNLNSEILCEIDIMERRTRKGQTGTQGPNTPAACNTESNDYLIVIKYHKNDKDNVGGRKQNNKSSMTTTAGKAKVNQAYVKYESDIDECHISEVAYSNKNLVKAIKPFTGIKNDPVETSNSVNDDYVSYDPDERHGSGGTSQLTDPDGEGYGNDADYENLAGAGITKDTEKQINLVIRQVGSTALCARLHCEFLWTRKQLKMNYFTRRIVIMRIAITQKSMQNH